MDKQELKEHAHNMSISFQMAGKEEIKAVALEDLDDLIDQLDEPGLIYATEKAYLNELNRLETENKELRDELEQPSGDINNLFGIPEQKMKWVGQAMAEKYRLGKAEGYAEGVEAVKELFRR